MVRAAWASIGRPLGAAHRVSADTASGQASVRKPCFSKVATGWRWRQPWTRSCSVTAAASTSRNHTVPGTLPACSSASVSAPKATNSPCGMKMTRVTAKTSTVASASSA